MGFIVSWTLVGWVRERLPTYFYLIHLPRLLNLLLKLRDYLPALVLRKMSQFCLDSFPFTWRRFIFLGRLDIFSQLLARQTFGLK